MERLNLKEKLAAYGFVALFGSAILFNLNQVYSALSNMPNILIDKEQESSVKIINYENKIYSGKKIINWDGNVFYNFTHPPDTTEFPLPADSSDYYNSSFGKEEHGEEGFELDVFKKYKNNKLENIVEDTANSEFNSRQDVLRKLIGLYNKN